MTKIVLTILLIVGSVSICQAQQKPAPQASAIGRYQIISNPEFAKFQFLLDTSTGKVWQCCIKEADGSQIWVPMVRE